MAFPIIRLFFGNQWDAAVPVMRWLCGAAILGTLTFQCSEFFTAIGRIGVVTSVQIQYQLVRVVIAIMAALISIEAVAASQIIVYAIAAMLYYRKLSKFKELAFAGLTTALVPSVLVTILTCVGPVATVLWLTPIAKHFLLALSVATVGAGLGWLLGLMLTSHPLKHEIRYGVSLLGRRFLNVRS